MVKSGDSHWHHTRYLLKVGVRENVWIDKYHVNCTVDVIYKYLRGLAWGTRKWCFPEVGVSMKMGYENWYCAALYSTFKHSDAHSDVTFDDWAYVHIAFLLSMTYNSLKFGTPYVETHCTIKIVFISSAVSVVLHFCLFLQPHVRVWNSVSLHTLAVIGIGELERSICCLSFSKAVSTWLLTCVLMRSYMLSSSITEAAFCTSLFKDDDETHRT